MRGKVFVRFLKVFDDISWWCFMIHCSMDFVDDVESFEMIYYVFIRVKNWIVRRAVINYFKIPI